MKITNFLAAGLVSLTLVSCSSAPTKPLSVSRNNLSGKGTVAVSHDANQNTKLKVEVDHLAPPERVSQEAKTYVVWITPLGEGAGETEQTQSLGALSIDNKLNGKLSAVTPFRAFDLFITAEPAATVAQPSGERMFWTQINHRKT
jgi:hypothetical protein